MPTVSRPTLESIHVRTISTVVAANSRPPWRAAPRAAQGSDPISGETSATCANCHGTNGVRSGDVESPAGKDEGPQDAGEAGAKPATVMPSWRKATRHEQIEFVAGWFAAQKPEVRKDHEHPTT
jgi:cytochrome c553